VVIASAPAQAARFFRKGAFLHLKAEVEKLLDGVRAA
jgi:hypothetical protein